MFTTNQELLVILWGKFEEKLKMSGTTRPVFEMRDEKAEHLRHRTKLDANPELDRIDKATELPFLKLHTTQEKYQ